MKKSTVLCADVARINPGKSVNERWEPESMYPLRFVGSFRGGEAFTCRIAIRSNQGIECRYLSIML